MTIKKRIVSMLLAVMMLLQIMPVPALAEGGAVVVPSNVLKGAEYHVVVFKLGDQVLAEQYVLNGQSLVLPEAPAVEGQRFQGWYAGDTQVTAETAVTGDMTVEAVMAPIGNYTFTVHYRDADGNTVADSVVRSYTTDDELPVNADGVKYVTIASPVEVAYNGKTLFPRTSVVTFLLTGESAQTVTVILAEANVTYAVMHMAMAKVVGEDGSVTFTEDGATLIEREEVGGVAGSVVVPEGKELDSYVFHSADSLTLSNVPNQYVNAYYVPVTHTLRYDSQEGSYIAPRTAYHGETVKVYDYTAGGEYICGLEEHTHSRECWDWSGYSCGRTAHTHDAGCLSADVYDPAPERAGYVFSGWYLDAECTIPADASIVLSEDTTVYACWTADQTDYTVVYLKQVYNNDTEELEYVYHASANAKGVVGEMTAAARGTVPSRYHHEKTENVVIKADGSSVATVYYDLTEYTLVFNLNNSSAAIVMGNDTYTGSSYRFTCVLGQNVSTLWPTQARVTNTDRSDFYGWTRPGEDSTYVTNRYEVTDDMLPYDGGTELTYTGSWRSNMETKFVGYWLQDVNGQYYELSPVYTQSYVSSGDLSAKSIYGFTYVGSSMDGTDASGNAYPRTGRDYTYGGETYDGNVVSQFYYDRGRFQIDYFYAEQNLDTRANVYFGTDITGADYNWTPSPASVGLAADYTFAGWFDNADCQGDPYHFTTMPGNNLALYAKFIPPQRVVTLVYQDGVTADGKIELALGATVDALPVPSRLGYTFQGWYLADGTPFDVTMPITENITIYAHWKMNNLQYTVRYLENGTGDELAADKVVSHANLTVGETVTESAVTIPGYRPMISVKSIDLAIDSAQNVITFYYNVRGYVDYTVHYYIHGTETSLLPDRVGTTSDERITVFAPTDVEYMGKTYYPTMEVQSLELMGDESRNIITFTYLPYKTADVVVNFYYDGVQDTSLTKEQTVRVGGSVNAGAYTADASYTKGGKYKFDYAEPENITVTAENDGATLVMNIYYVINESEYTINHYLLGTTTAIAPSTTAKAIIGATVDVNVVSGTGDYAHAVFDSFGGTGSIAVSGSTAALTIAVDAASNVVNVYYKLPVTVTANTAAYVYDGTPKTVAGADGLEYTVSGLVNGDAITGIDVTYTAGGASMQSATNVGVYTAQVAPIAAGAYPAYYTVTTANGTLTITPITTEIVITADSNEKVYDGTALVDAGYTYTQGILVDGDILTAVVEGSQTDVGESANVVTSYVVTRNGADVTANYTFGESVDGKLTVTKRPVKLTSATDSKVYDGTALTNATVTAEGFVDGEGATYTVTGSQLDVGTSDNTFTYALNEGTKAENYEIEVVFGTLTVTPITTEIIITADSNEKVYDGTALVDAGYTYTQDILVDGDVLTAVVEGSQTDVGESANVVTSYVVTRNGADVTANYTFGESVDGKLTVTKRPVKLTSATDSKVYDGVALTNATVTAEGFVDGEGATYTVTGTQLDVGTSDNTFTYALNSNTKAENYEIEVVFGTLTVTPITNEIIITANSNEKVYDGTALTDNGYTYTQGILVDGDILTAVVEGSQTDVGESANVVTSYVVTRNGADVTANYTFGASVDGKLTVTKRPVKLTSATDEKVYDGTALTNATVTAEGFVTGEGATYTVTGTQLDVGTSDNTFTYALNSNTKAENYEIEVVFGTLTVTPITNEIIITANSNEKVYDGTALTDDGYTYTQGILMDGDVLTAVVAGSQTDVGESANVVTSYVVTRNGADVTANYTFGASVDGKLTVTKRPVKLTSATDSKVYDGVALTNATVTAEGFVEGEGATYTVTGTQLDVGTSDNTFTYALNEGTKADNYEIEVVFGTLTVTPITTEIIITADSNEKVYDGTALTDDGYTYTQGILVDGDVLTAVVEGTQTDVGESANVVTSYVVTRTSDGKDVTANYTFGESVDGKLVVTKRPVKLTSATDSKVYDGIALTNDEVTAEGFVDGEGATYTVTGSQLDVGTSDNTFTYVLNEGTKAENYEIEVVFGTLTVTPITTEIIITADSNEKVYDGTALTDNGYTYTQGILVDGDILTAVVEGSQTDVGESANVVTSYKVMRGETDVTGNYTFGESVDGKLTVTKRPVKLTSATDSKVYDGIALTNDEVTAEGFVDGEGATYTVTGSQLDVGTSDNTFTYALNEGTKAENYEIEVVFGTLTVTPITTEIVITADSNEKVYDGTALTDDGYTYTQGILVDGDVLTAVVEGSQTDVGESANVVTSYVVTRTSDGKDVTANYTFGESVDGVLKVNPRQITLTSATDTKEYDGLPLTNDTVTITGDGFVDGEGVTYTVTGSQTYVGESDNTFAYTLNEGTKEINYIITVVLGKLTVTGPTLIPEKTTPEVESNYDLGEAIPFTITVQNVRDMVIENVNVTDENAVILPGAGYTVSDDGHTAVIPTMQIGEIIRIAAQHIVTEEDILAGTVNNVANVTWGDESFFPEAETDHIADIDATITLVKTTLGVKNAEGGYTLKETYNIGDTLYYSIDVTNAGNVTVYNMQVRDAYTGMNETVDALAVGGTVSFVTSMQVTVEHVLAGTIYNLATAEGEIAPTELEYDPPYAEDDEVNQPEPIRTDLLVEKTILGIPSNGSYWNKKSYELHDQVHFLITVKNTGNVPYRNMHIVDERTGLDVMVDKLAVGETVTFETVYEVNVGHIIAGYMLNIVTAKGEVDGETMPGVKQPEGWDDETAPTVPENYTVPLGSMTMNVGDCFE